METSQWRRAVEKRCVFSARLKALSEGPVTVVLVADGSMWLVRWLRCPAAVRACGTSKVPSLQIAEVTFKSRKWLQFAYAEIRGAEKRKVQDPNDRLCQVIKSWREEDERKDSGAKTLVTLVTKDVGWRCCMRSARLRYCRRPVCSALKVKVASLSCIQRSNGNQ